MEFRDRIGEKFTNILGEHFEIIEYFSSANCTIQFADGVVRKNIAYRRIKAGNIYKESKSENLQRRVGEKYITNQGYEIQIVAYRRRSDCDVVFLNSGLVVSSNYNVIKKGGVENPFHLSVFGVGCIGVGEYNPKGKFYETWRSILRRCYNKKFQEKQQTYKGVTVCEEWHNFQNFAKWMDENYNIETMLGFELDKDIICSVCKLYSPATCCFVPREINMLFRVNSSRDRDYVDIANKWKNKISVEVYTILLNL